MEPILIEIGNTENIRHFRTNDGIKKEKYFNYSRLKAFEFSPFDETLMLDTDVLILDDRLKLCWGSRNEMMINHCIGRMYTLQLKPRPQKMDDISLDVLWATITYFKRTPQVAKFFELANHIMKDFPYYGMLYKFPVSLYRNDYAFTVASHIMSGYIGGDYRFVRPLPVPYTTFAWEDDELLDVERGRALFRCGTTPVVVRNTVHCMNKSSMLANADRILEHYA